MASPVCCDAGKPVVLEYAKHGERVNVDGVDVYVTGAAECSRCIIFIPDIFGFEFSQVFQVADRLADCGFSVAVFDPFKGEPWPMSDFPPSDAAKFMDWITSMPLESVAASAANVRQWMAANRGAASFGVTGFCWGSSVSLFMAGSTSYKASACCHPAFFGQDKQLAEAACCPVCIISTAEDPLETPKAVLDTKSFAGKCKYQRFGDQVHGFMAARGDYSKPEVAAAAGKGIGVLADFFSACMPA
eukprot:jgi/Ulvmu1/1427/UM011_0156.1